jgi:vancomycin permeability regulator SanA
MRKWLRYIAYFLITWFIVHTAFISYDGLSDNVQKADCILILGNTVNPDGSLSARLKSRTDRGIELYKAGFSKTIMVSGGLGKEGYYEGTSMRNYLVAHGVSSNDVIVDNAGNNTDQTARNFKEIATVRHFGSVIVVSQFSHISRTKLLLRKRQFHGKIFSAHARYFELRDVYAVFREFLLTTATGLAESF